MSILGRGTSHEEMMEKQRDDSIHANNVADDGVWNDEGLVRTEYLQELVDHGLDESTVRPLRFLLSKDFVLSNLQRAEVDELKWLARWMALIVKADHPPKQSGIKGEYRKFLRDDDSDGKQPLDTETTLLIEQFVMDVFSRGTRGLDGFQQQEMSKSYTVSEVKDDKNKNRGLL